MCILINHNTVVLSKSVINYKIDNQRYAYYNIDTDVWTPYRNVSNGSGLEYGVVLSPISNNRFMAVWNADADGDMYPNLFFLNYFN